MPYQASSVRSQPIDFRQLEAVNASIQRTIDSGLATIVFCAILGLFSIVVFLVPLPLVRFVIMIPLVYPACLIWRSTYKYLQRL